jgi:hypothetical protein
MKKKLYSLVTGVALAVGVLVGTVCAAGATEQFTTLQGIPATEMSTAKVVGTVSTAGATEQFTTLQGIPATEMSTAELEAVQGKLWVRVYYRPGWYYNPYLLRWFYYPYGFYRLIWL